MTNRHLRRAAAKVEVVIPNISGTNESCVNCHAAISKAVQNKIIAIMGKQELAAGRPAPQSLPQDEITCARDPGGGVRMKTWGWCASWKGK